MAQSTNKNKKRRTPARRSCIKKKYNLRSSKKSGSKKSGSKKSGSKKSGSKTSSNKKTGSNKSQRYAGHNLFAINKEIADKIKEISDKTVLLEKKTKLLGNMITRQQNPDLHITDLEYLAAEELETEIKILEIEIENAKIKLVALQKEKNTLIGLTPNIKINDPKSPYHVRPKK